MVEKKDGGSGRILYSMLLDQAVEAKISGQQLKTELEELYGPFELKKPEGKAEGLRMEDLKWVMEGMDTDDLASLLQAGVDLGHAS